MKKMIPILIIGIFVLSGLGVGALQSDEIQPDFEITDFQDPLSSSLSKNYTHTVLVEVGTATWCPDCPASNIEWHDIYGTRKYDFEYVELVSDVNPAADARFFQFNPMWVPTSYWDGGGYVYPDTNAPEFRSYLDLSGSRVVPDLVSDLNVMWLGSTEIKISYSVINNEASNYQGHLRIYVIELESTKWVDQKNHPYYHAFLNFAVNQGIDIPTTGMISDTIIWNGTAKGFPDITSENIQVILAVFGNTPHDSYSDPPSGNLFNAYYSDECTAATPGDFINNPPATPTINGPTSGNAGTAYTYNFSTIDPDGDDVRYCINWSDDTGEVCLGGTFASGEEINAAHTWSEQGTYAMKVKARDIFGAESDWATLTVTMPYSYKIPLMLFWMRILERFPPVFPQLKLLADY
jgi:hypothetical protein